MVVEKVRRLLRLLDAIRGHPFLGGRVVLKGGTALNLFLWDVPRLSVDLDLNYIGSESRENMLADRPLVEQGIEAVCRRQGISVGRVPGEHAGGKWRLRYSDDGGTSGTLEIDVNFLDRVRLWPVVEMDSRMVGGTQASRVSVLDAHELAAGKLAALLARDASRDLFDARRLLADQPLDPGRLRLSFLVYGGMSRKDWRTVTLDDVTVSARDIETKLIPVLRSDVVPPREEIAEWGRRLVDEVRDRLSIVLPLAAHEREFLDALNDRGEIRPDLLTGDLAVQDLLRGHPGLRWKAISVRSHRGISAVDGDGA